MSSKLTKYFIFSILTVDSLISCSNSSTRTIENSTNHSDGSVDTKTVKTEVSPDNSKSCSGIASCTVDFLGAVIAFPFRLVAGVVEIIF